MEAGPTEDQEMEASPDHLSAWTEHQVVYRARVGDRLFRLGKRVLQAAGPQSLLMEFVPPEFSENKVPEVFFDRSATTFASMVESLRTGIVPKYSRALLLEALYFRVVPLVRALRAKKPKPKPSYGPVPSTMTNPVFAGWLTSKKT